MYLTAGPSIPTINGDNIKTVLLVLAAIIFILYRLMRRHQVNAISLLAPIVVLGFFGIDGLNASHNVVAVAILIVSLAVEVLIGVLLGRTYTMWRDQAQTPWSQGTHWTLIVWGVAFAFRIAIAIVESAINGGLGDTSEILLSLAATFLGQNVVVGLRAGFLGEWVTQTRSGPPDDSTGL
ncbi:MAG: hypothetical protein ACREQM_08335 [Candidatus Dormibacteraceae bacterium]